MAQDGLHFRVIVTCRLALLAVLICGIPRAAVEAGEATEWPGIASPLEQLRTIASAERGEGGAAALRNLLRSAVFTGVRVEAAEALLRLNASTVADEEALLDGFSAPGSVALRVACLGALRKISPWGVRTRSRVLAAALSDSDLLRIPALEALADQSRGDVAIEVIAPLLKHSNSYVRLAATSVAIAHGDRSKQLVQSLVRDLSSSDAAVRAKAWPLVGQLGAPPENVEDLLRIALLDSDGRVPVAAIRAVSVYPLSRGAVRHILEFASDDKSVRLDAPLTQLLETQTLDGEALLGSVTGLLARGPWQLAALVLKRLADVDVGLGGAEERVARFVGEDPGLAILALTLLRKWGTGVSLGVVGDDLPPFFGPPATRVVGVVGSCVASDGA
jgi:hypothetical protein